MMIWPNITKNTPIKKVLLTHRRIWDEVIKNIERFRNDIVERTCPVSVIIEKLKPETPYYCDCALCSYAIARKTEEADMPFRSFTIQYACCKCLGYDVLKEDKGCLNGIYTEFYKAIENRDIHAARYWAEEIRTIPDKYYLKQTGDTK